MSNDTFTILFEIGAVFGPALVMVFAAFHFWRWRKGALSAALLVSSLVWLVLAVLLNLFALYRPFPEIYRHPAPFIALHFIQNAAAFLAFVLLAVFAATLDRRGRA